MDKQIPEYFCDISHMELITNYCNECKMAACDECTQYDHLEHLESVDDWNTNIKHYLKKGGEYSEKLNILLEHELQSSASLDRMEVKESNIIKQIDNAFDKLISHINSKRDAYKLKITAKIPHQNFEIETDYLNTKNEEEDKSKKLIEYEEKLGMVLNNLKQYEIEDQKPETMMIINGTLLEEIARFIAEFHPTPEIHLKEINKINQIRKLNVKWRDFEITETFKYMMLGDMLKVTPDELCPIEKKVVPVITLCEKETDMESNYTTFSNQSTEMVGKYNELTFWETIGDAQKAPIKELTNEKMGKLDYCKGTMNVVNQTKYFLGTLYIYIYIYIGITSNEPFELQADQLNKRQRESAVSKKIGGGLTQPTSGGKMSSRSTKTPAPKTAANTDRTHKQPPEISPQAMLNSNEGAKEGGGKKKPRIIFFRKEGNVNKSLNNVRSKSPGGYISGSKNQFLGKAPNRAKSPPPRREYIYIYI